MDDTTKVEILKKVLGEEAPIKLSTSYFPYVYMFGLKGDGGLYNTSNIPKKYKDCLIENLPIGSDNPKILEILNKFISDFDKYVANKGVGLFMFSIPDENNPYGTGTGKTTSAITILNEYLIFRANKHLLGNEKITSNPCIFVKGSDLQNIYNSQFRGGFTMQEEASIKYYKTKEAMKNVDLLAIDDIGIRNISEAFTNEFYEIIDHRATEGKSTIFTSNIPLPELTKIYGDRIISRIEGMCFKLGFKGKDNRIGGVF